MRKLEAILRDEMEAVGAQEFLLPSLHPAEVWRTSGRWEDIDETMFRLRDRHGGDYCLAMTHEEVFTLIARSELSSYRQLPQRWYQIGLKFRDEPRPKAGLLRVREFQMKDAYSFDLDQAGLDVSFERMRAAYARIFARCGVDARPTQADSGAMGGSESIEFVTRTPAGEDEIVECAACGYRANVEVARSRIPPVLDDGPADSRKPELFATPGVVTIDALSAPPYNVPPQRQLKTLVYVADARLVVAVLRGDHALNLIKLQAATGARAVRPARTDEVVELLGAHPGSLGAAHFSATRVLVDEAVQNRRNMVTGANRDGFHVRGVDVARDVVHGEHANVVDLRTVAAGDGCPTCGAPLECFSALEVGHIFKLGTRYSASMGATVLCADGTPVSLVMGSYGIGLGRLLAAVVEQNHDRDGIVWPAALAPFDATVLTLGDEPELAELAETVIGHLSAAGLDVLYDERDQRPGVKFKDADLIGIPLRIGVGRRGLAQNAVEWKRRCEPSSELVPLNEFADRLIQRPASSGSSTRYVSSGLAG
jgi:prolyl-tRNA synthetase